MSTDPLADLDAEITTFLRSAGVEQAPEISKPPQREFGERATSVALRLTRERRQPPRAIAEEIADTFVQDGYQLLSSVEAAPNGFINFRVRYETFVPHVIDAVRQAGPLYGRRPDAAVQDVVVEHTSVNPNKEWHIGHLRNAVLGDVVARLLRLAGHRVQVQNYIDDTGPQAAQSVLGLTAFPEQRAPGEKFDRFAGRPYVKITAELAAEENLKKRLAELDTVAPGTRDAEQDRERISVRARLDNIDRLKKGIVATMRSLETGEHRDVVQSILAAQLQTAYRLGVYYDLLNWESHLVQSGAFDDAMKRLQQSPHVYWAGEGRYAGALVIQTGEAEGGDEPKAEVLIRSNGIPTYVGKDIAYAMWKFGLLPNRIRYVKFADEPNGQTLWSTALRGEEWDEPKPDRVVNVVAVHQSQAQEAVKLGLRAAGFEKESEELFHLGYGMVSSQAGKMSGRKGTGVPADAVIDEAVRVAYERAQEKRSQGLTDAEMQEIAEAVGVAAVRYFMVQYNPLRDIVFDVKDVVSYDGNTGLYLQYALVRMFAILRRAFTEHEVTEQEVEDADATLLQHEQERRLAFHLAQYPGVVADASRLLAVNLVAEFAFDLATIFSQFYRDCGVLNADPPLRKARLLLVRTVRDVMVNACEVLGLPVIERL